MSLTQIRVKNFRNLHESYVEPSPGLNLIFGANASGKSSFLEAVHVLLCGKSFRTNKFNHLIHHEADFFRLFGRLLPRDCGDVSETPIGVERTKTDVKIRLDGKDIRKISELVKLTPLICLHPDSHSVISGSPMHRRQFIDWGVFHVEHRFYNIWLRYQKALKQRNAAIRNGLPERLCRVWDEEICLTGNEVHGFRSEYVDALSAVLQRYSQLLFAGQALSLQLKRGWDESTQLKDVLRDSFRQDSIRGATQYGPHRAELKIKLDQRDAQIVLSRGQQKSLVALLKTAQAVICGDKHRNDCILLYDDLPAELDEHNRKILMSILSQLPIQAFVTATDRDTVPLDGWVDRKMFHVEHGKMVEVV